MIAALRRIPPLEGGLLLVATVVLVWLGVLSGGAKVRPGFDSYSSYDAAGGGYRAFYDLLDREGARVDRFERRPIFLSRDAGTLVYAEPLAFDPEAGTLAKGDIGALENWVRDGGRLLYLGHDEAAARAGVLHLPRTGPSLVTAKRIAPPGVERVAVASDLRWHLRKGISVVFADRHGPVAIGYSFGHGRVVAVVDETLFENRKIATGDAARLAYALAVQGDTPVTFDEAVHGHLIPIHWWSIVPRPFLIALVVAGIALFVAFAGAAVRFGPPLIPVPRDDRTTADFIDALSSLLARGGAIRTALTDASASTVRSVARALGLDDRASNEDIAERIDRDDLRAAFREMIAIAANGFADERNLVRGVALAQRLRKEYAAHGRPSY